MSANSVSIHMQAEAWPRLWPVLEELGANEQFPDGTGCEAAIQFVRAMVAENKRLMDENDRLRAVERSYADLMAVVVQPWDWDGNGTVHYKINLSWWDSAETEDQAHEMVRELAARVKTKRGVTT